MINVTKPFLPPAENFIKLTQDIFERNWLTNNGPLVLELEEKLRSHLRQNNLWYVTNGTVALQLAIKALELKGEVITTPFSYVATTSSLVWEGLQPVFSDIDPDTFNLDPLKIEEKITERTSAILATHVFGNPCHVEAIKEIAEKNNLKVIYDAAHAFGVTWNDESLLNWGDMSTMSFHATKLYHTVEGGAVVSGNSDLHHRISYLRNFGHKGYEAFQGIGINGKNSEFHAAMGLANFEHIEAIMAKYKSNYELYMSFLCKSDRLSFQLIQDKAGYNHAYVPVVFESEELLLRIKESLKDQEVYPRRYFYPSLNHLPYLEYRSCPVSEQLSRTILCLPQFFDLKEQEIESICQIILKNLRNA